MRVLALLRGKRGLWVSLILAAAAVAFSYPTLDRRTRIFYAERALKERKADIALDWLNSIPEHQNDGQREFLIARCYRRLGQPDLVRDHLQLAFDLGYSVERLEREQWLMLAQSGQIREAEPYLRQLLLDPGDDGQEICESYVSGYLRNRQFWKAIPMLDAWQAEFPGDPKPHAIRGAQFQEADQWPDAIAAYEKVLELTPGDTRIRLQLAMCLKAALRYDEAEREFRQCLAETPQEKSVLAEWGDMLLSIGKTSEAAAVFEQLLVADPENPNARFGTAGILLMNGKPDEAVPMLKALYAERPYDTKIQYSFATALQAAGKTEQASQIFQQVAEAEAQLRRKQKLMDDLESSPDQVEPRFEIATIAMKHESPEEGLRWLLSVINMDPGYAPAYAALADYYQNIGNAEMAQYYRKLAKPGSNETGKP